MLTANFATVHWKTLNLVLKHQMKAAIELFSPTILAGEIVHYNSFN